MFRERFDAEAFVSAAEGLSDAAAADRAECAAIVAAEMAKSDVEWRDVAEFIAHSGRRQWAFGFLAADLVMLTCATHANPTPVESKFLTDLYWRARQHGDNLRLSERQWSWLRRIAESVGIAVSGTATQRLADTRDTIAGAAGRNVARFSAPLTSVGAAEQHQQQQ